ncbi:hypothetical protein TNIN_212821 [Trichonephila inaurata madagascariensis]|uniref:Uncharacterized protein n=1 Tax=Trichonephila inaurata madagascariensis TaxID=2747483 RepID=A0A8X6WUD9_9ARAC|nr:hypothetical protein TNIN_212821 [Trichonephila inaurata madagascariensis]
MPCFEVTAIWSRRGGGRFSGWQIRHARLPACEVPSRPPESAIAFNDGSPLACPFNSYFVIFPLLFIRFLFFPVLCLLLPPPSLFIIFHLLSSLCSTSYRQNFNDNEPIVLAEEPVRNKRKR